MRALWLATCSYMVTTMSTTIESAHGEARAVHVNLGSEEAVSRACHAVQRRPDVTQVIVQRHLRDGVEMSAGAFVVDVRVRVNNHTP